MEEQERPQGMDGSTDRRLPVDDGAWKQRYRGEWMTGGLVLGLALFAVLGLQYLLRGVVEGSALWAGLLSLAPFGAIVAVQVVYGRRAAALRRFGFTYGRAFGFEVLVCLLSGIVYGAGYFLLAEVVDPVYFGRTLEQVVAIYLRSGLMTVEQARQAMELMHSLPAVICATMLAMVLQGGFVALFTAAIVRHRDDRRY